MVIILRDIFRAEILAANFNRQLLEGGKKVKK